MTSGEKSGETHEAPFGTASSSSAIVYRSNKWLMSPINAFHITVLFFAHPNGVYLPGRKKNNDGGRGSVHTALGIGKKWDILVWGKKGM